MQKMLERVLESGGFLYCRTCELRVFGDGATGGAIIGAGAYLRDDEVIGCAGCDKTLTINA